MKKIQFLEDFKTFATKGNMIDMAVGIIIGGAFGKIVSSIVSDLLMPPLGLLIGGVNFTDLKLTLKPAVTDPATGAITDAVTMNYGQFIQSTIDFLIIAFSIFILVRIIGKLQRKKEEAPAAPAPKPEDIQLLGEIRDLLKENARKEK